MEAHVTSGRLGKAPSRDPRSPHPAAAGARRGLGGWARARVAGQAATGGGCGPETLSTPLSEQTRPSPARRGLKREQGSRAPAQVWSESERRLPSSEALPGFPAASGQCPARGAGSPAAASDTAAGTSVETSSLGGRNWLALCLKPVTDGHLNPRACRAAATLCHVAAEVAPSERHLRLEQMTRQGTQRGRGWSHCLLAAHGRSACFRQAESHRHRCPCCTRPSSPQGPPLRAPRPCPPPATVVLLLLILLMTMVTAALR